MGLPTLCAEASEYVGEPIAGTAAFATTWIFVEEAGPWAVKPIESIGIAQDRELLGTWLSTLPNARLQLIRRPGEARSTRRVFIAEPAQRRIRRFDVAQLSDVDLFGGSDFDETFYAVCTHGKRDRCCALRGFKLFGALHQATRNVWQTSHLGGHRFAATMIVLPHGYCYGRLEPDEAASLAAATEDGVLHDLPKLRGRTSYRGPVQAGEIALRQSLQLTGLDDLVVLRIQHDPSEWRIRFRAHERTWLVTVRPEITGTLRPKSCGADVQAVEVYPCAIKDIT